MSNVKPWFSDPENPEVDFIELLRSQESARKEVVLAAQARLVSLLRRGGQSTAEAETSLQDFGSTFGAELVQFILFETTAAVAAIAADVTLAWLDTDVSGTTIRQRLINQLS